MSLNSERFEIKGIVNRLMDSLSSLISSQTAKLNSIHLRKAIGDMRANYMIYLREKTFSEKLLECFTIARESEAKLAGFINVHRSLFAEKPQGQICNAIVQAAIGYCLSAESRIITGITFKSRDDAETILKSMKASFDAARDLSADAPDSDTYKALTFLSGALTNHLMTQALELPRIVKFSLKVPLPALALSNRIYYDANRWEEIIEENRIVHPAFCPREIRGLSV
jgi:hypothetical protein